MAVKQIVTDKAPPSSGHYSQGVHAGPYLFVSGQLPFTPQQRVLPDSARGQANQCLRNIISIVTEAGGKACDIVQLTIYIASIDLWPDVDFSLQRNVGTTLGSSSTSHRPSQDTSLWSAH